MEEKKTEKEENGERTDRESKSLESWKAGT